MPRKDGKSQYQLYKERYQYQCVAIEQVEHWLNEYDNKRTTLEASMKGIRETIKLAKRWQKEK